MGEREIGPRSDVYALGAMTYEMLAGEPPFTGPSSQAIVAKVLTEQPPPLRAKRPTVPPAGGDRRSSPRCRSCPADRWGSAKEFSDALGGHRAAAPDRAPPTIPLRRRPGAGRGRARGRRSLARLGRRRSRRRRSPRGRCCRPRPELPPSRLAILAPGLGGSGASSSQRHLTFAPDGQALVYSMMGTDGELRLVRQSLDAEAPTRSRAPSSWAVRMVSPGRPIGGRDAGREEPGAAPAAGGRQPGAAGPLAAHRSDDAAWAPDGSLWVSTRAAVSRQVVGDSLVAGSPGRPVPDAADPRDGRTALVAPDSASATTGGPVLLVDLESGSRDPAPATRRWSRHGSPAAFSSFVLPGGNLQAAPSGPEAGAG